MFLEVEKYIPQRTTMKLIDQLIEVNDHHALCQTYITEDKLFYDAALHGIPAYVGLEFMGQTVAAFAGFQNGASNHPSIGFLLSVRNFHCEKAVFQLGDTLTIKAIKDYLSDSIGVFDCEIISKSKPIARAKLNTIQPNEKMLSQLKSKNNE